MKRTILNKYEVYFDYTDTAVLGYLVGGEMQTEEPCDLTKETFEGDWCPVLERDVWSLIHNGDRSPVTFWKDTKTFVTYYPKPNNDGRFVVVEARFID